MEGSAPEVAVIGGGPAGVAAAYQCKREGVDDVIIVEKNKIGGLIEYANRIENIPGYLDMDGRAVVSELESLLKRANISVLKGGVEDIQGERGNFRIHMKEGNITCRHAVVATGTIPRTLGIDGEVCHPPWKDYHGKRVLVVGGGDAAYDYALRINRYGGKVTILSRNTSALDLLVRRVGKESIREVRGELDRWEKHGHGYTVDTTGGTIECDLVVTAIGRVPQLPVKGYGEIRFPTGCTDIPGLYVIGSAALDRFRQVTLCWGMGIAAAMDIASHR